MGRGSLSRNNILDRLNLYIGDLISLVRRQKMRRTQPVFGGVGINLFVPRKGNALYLFFSTEYWYCTSRMKWLVKFLRYAVFVISDEFEVKGSTFLMKTSNLIWNMRRDNLYSESWFSAHPRQPKDVKTKYSDDFCDRYKNTLGAKRVSGVGNVV